MSTKSTVSLHERLREIAEIEAWEKGEGATLLAMQAARRKVKEPDPAVLAARARKKEQKAQANRLRYKRSKA